MMKKGILGEAKARYAENAAGAAPAPDDMPDVTTREGRVLEGLEAQNKALKSENKKLKAHLMNQEELVDRIVAESTEPLPPPSFEMKLRKRTDKPKRAIMLPIFDCQYGAFVRATDTVGNIGGFDADIFSHRVDVYIEKQTKTMEDYAAGHAIEELVIPIGGDTVEGDEIFAGQEWQLCLDPPAQVMGVRNHLARIIHALMEAGAELGVQSVSLLLTPGNHGRVGGRRTGARPTSYNWDIMVYHLLEEMLANYPIRTFAIEPAGNCLFDVKGNLCSMIHGDEVRGWGGLPFYGLTRHDAKMIRTLNVIPEYVFLGHHHQPASIPIGYGEHLMSGNWVGASSLSKIVGSNCPSQWFFGISEEWGVCDRSLIYLDERRKPTPTIHQTA
jgi:hypothetical protein